MPTAGRADPATVAGPGHTGRACEDEPSSGSGGTGLGEHYDRHGHEHGHEHGHDGDAHRHGHLAASAQPMFTLRSVGIDVGSSTTSITVSELVVGRLDALASRKPQVLDRRLLHASRVLFTPFSDSGAIDAATLGRFFDDELRAAGLTAHDVDTGALICTGEAARRENAAAMSAQLADRSGKFVAAAAGHHLEAVLGAYGSGAVERSRALPDAPLVLLDMGGGTTKRTLLHAGRILSTAAINVGARLVAWRDDGVISRLEPAGATLGQALGLRLQQGAPMGEADRDRLADLMVELTADFFRGGEPEGIARQLSLTAAPPRVPAGARVMLTGGVSEYVHRRSTFAANDLGPRIGARLGAAVRAATDGELLESTAGIRATVLGAGQFSVQVSGETVFHNGSVRLPLHGAPVRRALLDWREVTTASVRAAVDRALAGTDPAATVALAFERSPMPGYRAARLLGSELGGCLARSPGRSHVLVFEDNVGRTVGQALVDVHPEVAVMCVDELDVGDLDFLDVGQPNHHGILPVVVKSLVFG